MTSRLLLLLACASMLSTALSQDVGGSKDYPELGRFKGSAISSYAVENYGKTVFATGPVKSKKDAKTTAKEVEGKITRMIYKVPKGISPLEVFRNYEKRCADRKYKTLFSGGPKDFKKYDFVYNHPVEILNNISLGDQIHYLFAEKDLPGGGKVFLSILSSEHSGGDGLRLRLIAAETKAMEFQMVDAEAMNKDISESGRVALYGIHFDHDKAVVKPESKPTLAEITKLLKGDPKLKLIVVGHTDHTGGYDYNMDLSARRAKAVVAALGTEFSERLRSAGVGFLSPAASNDSEVGKAKNRRVELIKGD